MWISSTAQQAIHALLCVAAFEDEGPVRVDEIAAAIGCPRNYLSKTLHVLARDGVLRSTRGPKGGFQLAAPAKEITLAQVIAPFEAAGRRRCLMGQPKCGDARPCAMHHRWNRVVSTVESFFTHATVASLLEGNPRAANSVRAALRTARLSSRRKLDGSHARRT